MGRVHPVSPLLWDDQRTRVPTSTPLSSLMRPVPPLSDAKVESFFSGAVAVVTQWPGTSQRRWWTGSLAFDGPRRRDERVFTPGSSACPLSEKQSCS